MGTTGWFLEARNVEKFERAWAATFPDRIGDVSESVLFFSRCVYVAFSNILASRQLLPQNIFKERSIDGDLCAYVMDTSEILGARLAQKFRGVSEAIALHYLREVTLIVTSSIESVTDVIETYTWRMRYDFDGEPQAELLEADGTVLPALQFRGMQHLKKQTAQLLIAISTLCQELMKPLPPGASAFIGITYTDRTPKEYQAPGFYSFPAEAILRPDAQQMQIGSLQTEYHGVSIRMGSPCIDDPYVEELALKRKVTANMKDYFTNSSDEESSGGDEVQRSDNNDTVERISGTLTQQNSNDAPPATRTFDLISCAQLTPKVPPTRRGK
ncbi:hypothetical protein KIN20_007286 [Parelaphostrongylus tenuis]|uniref:HORMA domain-containing protein n=1 Tax=Parelaphostrongylus tenuis TaxID=148309 RepID=A0AAD5M354_PARTN|nr:hypothetical protein KIN20_007286 [Parelaphostrongylus tenuis]